jgi:hypothetical protein
MKKITQKSTKKVTAAANSTTSTDVSSFGRRPGADHMRM